MGLAESRMLKHHLINSSRELLPDNSTPRVSSATADSQSLYSISSSPDEALLRGPAFSWHDGRKYEGNGLLPNDEIEIERVRQQHFMLRWALGGNFHAPIQEMILNGKVLESGCGPGTWTLEMAQEWCHTQFYAIDDCSIAPQNIKPPNCAFLTCDFGKPLPFESSTFNFVYQRLMGLTIKRDGWKPLVKELIRVCKEGGWVQLVEIDFEPQNCGPRTARVFSQVKRALQDHDLNPAIARELPKVLKCHGLVNIKSGYTSVPVGWGGLLGTLFRADVYELLMSFKPWLSLLLALSEGYAYEQELNDMLDECFRFESYFNFHYAFGQRPLQFG